MPRSLTPPECTWRGARSAFVPHRAPEHRTSRGRRVALLVAGAVALLADGGAYGVARATHLLVRESPLCDPDHIRPGAGASPALRVVFAPLIALEDGIRQAREAWL